MRWQPYRAEARSLFAIAWPTALAQVAQIGTGVVDTIMAGRYSAEDLAAVAIGYNIWLPLFLFGLGMMIATSVNVAQAFGAGQKEVIRAALPQSLWLALLMGLVMVPICLNTAPLLDLLNLQSDTRAKSLAYLQAVAWGLPASALFQCLRCHNQGLGLMKPYAVASIIGFLANIPLNYMFMYGNWGAPELGAAGCGLATAVCMWLGLALILAYSVMVPAIREYLPAPRVVSPHWPQITAIFRLGLPIGLTFFLEMGVLSVIGLMIARYGNLAMGAHQIAINLWDLCYMPLAAVGSAMATRMGHAIGSGQPSAVQVAMRTGMGVIVLMGITIMVVLLSIPGPLVRLYTDAPGIFGIAERLIGMAAMFIVIDCLQIGGAFSLRAFRDTRFPFLVTCVSYWCFALPLGWLLGPARTSDPATGAVSIWIGLIAGIFVATVLVLWRVRNTLRKPLPTLEGLHSPGSPGAA